MVSQHVLVFGEDVNCVDVEVQKVSCPRGGASVYRSAFSFTEFTSVGGTRTDGSVNGQREINPKRSEAISG